MYRQLEQDEVKRFRDWARAHHSPGAPIEPHWHPVVRAECEAMDREACGS